MNKILVFLFFITSQCLARQNLEYFPLNYQDARDRFISYSKNFPDAINSEITVGSEKLSINICYLPAKNLNNSLVIITSGNHGPEAYLGSALQFMFMQEILPTLNRSKTGILLIHSLNPWGFKYHRRGTENNVNLNRNFDINSEIFKNRNDGYVAVKDLLEIKLPVTSYYSFPAWKLIGEMLFNKNVTRQSLTEAIGMGQYSFPQGINYGGIGFESQTLEVIDVLKKYASQYSEILNIDLHTGLGEQGVLHLMTKDIMNEKSKQKLDKITKYPEDEKFYRLTLPKEEGFYDIHGDYVTILNKIFTDKDKIIVPLTAEFGTIGNGLWGKIRTINRLILENQGYYFGYKNSEIEKKVKADYLDLFFPNDLTWRYTALRDGQYLLSVVLKRFIE